MNEARAITAGFTAVLGLAFMGSVIPGVNDFLDTWVLRIGLLGIGGFAVWFGVAELRDWLFYREAAKPIVQPLKPAPESETDEPDPVDLDELDDEAAADV